MEGQLAFKFFFNFTSSSSSSKGLEMQSSAPHLPLITSISLFAEKRIMGIFLVSSLDLSSLAISSPFSPESQMSSKIKND